jgi:hypothetical protein
MADTESLRQIIHSRAPLSTWFGVVLLFALFGVIVFAIIGPSPRGSDYEETRAKNRMEKLKTSREDAEKALNTYAWVDKTKGVARIPISRAMQLTVAELAQKKPAAAGPIATPQPQTSPAGAASPVAGSPAPAGSVKPGGVQAAGSPSAQAPVSPAPAAPAAAASPAAQNSVPPSPITQPPAAAFASPAPATSP